MRCEPWVTCQRRRYVSATGEGLVELPPAHGSSLPGAGRRRQCELRRPAAVPAPVFAAVQTSAACQRRFASPVRIPKFSCPAPKAGAAAEGACRAGSRCEDSPGSVPACEARAPIAKVVP
jgi:hypothetical protein